MTEVRGRPARPGIGLAAAVMVMVSAAVGGCRHEPVPEARGLDCGWPCGNRLGLTCVTPCLRGLRTAGAGAGPPSISTATLAACETQLAFDRDPRIGQAILTALSWFPCDAPGAVGPLILLLRERGQESVADAIEAKVAGDSGHLDNVMDALVAARDRGAPRCALVRIATWLVEPFYLTGRRGEALQVNGFGLDLLADTSPEATRDLRAPLIAQRVRMLAGTGQLPEALRVSEQELAQATNPSDQAWLHQVRFEMLLAQGKPKQAEAEVWETIRAALIALAFGDRDAARLQSATLYGLADLLREQGRFDEAEQALDLAKGVDTEASMVDQLYTRAQIKRDRGQLDLAEAGLNVALDPARTGEELKGDLTWTVPLDLGRVRVQRGDDAKAEEAFRRAIEAVERVRANGPGSDDPATESQMVADLRQPYEALLGLLAEQSRWDEALAMLARLDAGGFNSDRASSRSLSRGELDIEEPDASSSWSPTWSATSGPAVDADTLRRAWRGRDLVAVFRAGTSLCRIELVGGVVDGACVGDATELEAAARRLQADPNDRAAALALGAALIPHGEGPLDLLLIGPIARLPVSALRNAAGVVVGQRPVRRVLGLLATGTGGPSDGPPTVVGYAGPKGDAASAEQEATSVAQLLGARARVGAEATVAAVTAAETSLLHVAGHAQLASGVPQLELFDGHLTAPTISTMTRAPRLVVLASCDSASARDEGSWGSLAAAFLQAGSETVIASDRAVDDDAARAMMQAFYRAHGERDPARVLGGLVARLAEASAGSTTWAAFTVIAAPPRATTR